MFNRQAVTALKGSSNDRQDTPIRRFLRRRQGSTPNAVRQSIGLESADIKKKSSTVNLPPPSPAKRFLQSLVSKLGQKSTVAKSPTARIDAISSSSNATIDCVDKSNKPASYADALNKKQSVSNSNPPSNTYSLLTDELVTPRRRVFQREASHSSLAEMMTTMTPIELDRSHDTNVVDISLLDVTQDDVDRDESNDYDLINDDDLAIERHRFVKSFNRNKYVRGASKETVDDLDVSNNGESFLYDGKVLNFGAGN